MKQKKNNKNKKAGAILILILVLIAGAIVLVSILRQPTRMQAPGKEPKKDTITLVKQARL